MIITRDIVVSDPGKTICWTQIHEYIRMRYNVDYPKRQSFEFRLYHTSCTYTFKLYVEQRLYVFWNTCLGLNCFILVSYLTIRTAFHLYHENFIKRKKES